MQNVSASRREASSRGDPSPDRAGGGVHAPIEEFTAALYPGLNPLSIPAGDVLIRAVLPYLITGVMNLPQSIFLGGTSLLIVVAFSLDTMRQIEYLSTERIYDRYLSDRYLGKR